MKRLVVIPARGGSKRIPNKNIKDFFGKPMIAHVINIAKVTGIFDKIHVSTENSTIADIAKQYNCLPDFDRPCELADSDTPIMEVVKYVVETYEKRGEVFDTVVLLYATSPLADPNDIKKACMLFEESKKDKAIMSVTPFPAPVEQAYHQNEDSDLIPNDKKSLALNTQDLKKSYYDAGMFIICSPDYVKNDIKSGSYKGYQVPSYRVTDIDWPEDWERAEVLYKAFAGS